MHARIFAEGNLAFVRDKSEEPRAMSDFAPAAQRRARRMHPVGVVGVVAVHGILLVLFLLSATGFVDVAPSKPLVVVTLEPTEVKPPEPVPPKFEPPPLPEVPVFIAPEVDVTMPPPVPTITVPIAAPQIDAAPRGRGDGGDGGAAAKASYVKTILSKIIAAKRYPQAAKLRREEGVAELRFVIDRAGRVLSFSITKSSGSAALDREVTDLIQRVKLPPMPPEVEGSQLDLVVGPVEFSLH